ncbi:hypothetical protein [Consotaella salsifontis]|uniref:Uncharacterized protein n=1 Tax=Consotaella salsifontis TaxID=1365950 RepID=A0A1T4LU91_9HYPH|nr:hypothetical protein [Consotaella salsifontis]SJZ58283.1 hypothetical protein SAMN05428963_101366 [Consotaella salsifontis]
MTQMISTVAVDQCAAEACGDNRHAISIIHGLGIEYEWSERDALRDLRVFHGCVNVPVRLPAYIRSVK